MLRKSSRPATQAQLNFPLAVGVDAAGHLFVADGWNNVIRHVDLAGGTISTLAGNGTVTWTPDGPTDKSAVVLPPRLAVDAAGNLYFADATHRIRRVMLAGDTR